MQFTTHLGADYFMYCVISSVEGSFESKGSKFFSTLCPYAEFDSVLASLKAHHPKAVHFVYAYRYSNEFDQICECSSDDGEPKGSSGVPSLNVLRGEEIVDSGVIIVRYFGGTLLGVGGLVRAYTKAVQSAITNAKNTQLIVPYSKQDTLHIRCAYSQFERLKFLLEAHHLTITHQEFLSDAIWLSIQGIGEDMGAFQNECKKRNIILDSRI